MINNKGLNSLVLPENFKKLQGRLDYVLRARDIKGNILIDAFKHGASFEEVQQEIKKAFQNNKVVTKHKYHFLKYLQFKNWVGVKKGVGTITSVELIITLRRG